MIKYELHNMIPGFIFKCLNEKKRKLYWILCETNSVKTRHKPEY